MPIREVQGFLRLVEPTCSQVVSGKLIQQVEKNLKRTLCLRWKYAAADIFQFKGWGKKKRRKLKIFTQASSLFPPSYCWFSFHMRIWSLKNSKISTSPTHPLLNYLIFSFGWYKCVISNNISSGHVEWDVGN